MVMKKAHRGELREATEKGDGRPLPLGFDHSLSPHSVSKKSPNPLAALRPLPDLSLKQ